MSKRVRNARIVVPSGPKGDVGIPGSPSTNRYGDASGRTVVILGAGVAGMTAAHELAERGYVVRVIESAQFPGGKAATQYPWVELKRDSDCTRVQVPAEHGFRLFPSFYQHIIDTMSRIPFRRYQQPSLARRPTSRTTQPDILGRSYDTVADNLVGTQFAAMARNGSPPRMIPRAYGRTLDGFLRMIQDLSSSLQFSEAGAVDAYRFQLKCLQYISSCRQRRDDVKQPTSYGNKTWWQYLGGDRFSPSFQNEIDTFIRTMVAMDARRGNARTIGNVGMQLIMDLMSNGERVDRVLNGPSSDQWLLPWESYLRERGVEFIYGHRVTKLRYDESKRRVALVETEDEAEQRKLYEADFVVAALPLGAMQGLFQQSWANAMIEDDPGLAWIRDVDLQSFTAWMAGIQFYLEQDVPIVRGHVYYPESAWKLSSVSQAQFWGPDFFHIYGRSRFRGILSVDICDWQTREGQWTDSAWQRVAMECESADVVADEIWEQLRHGLTVNGVSALPDDYLAYHLDDAIHFPFSIEKRRRGEKPKTLAYNSSPYFIHPAGSHVVRPESRTAIENLVLAGDWVRTNTDLATMEGANESGRRAVNAILEADSLDGGECTLFDFNEPSEFDYAKQIDLDLFNRGDPHIFQAYGLLERFERASSPAAARAVVAVAETTLKGAQQATRILPNLISRTP